MSPQFHPKIWGAAGREHKDAEGTGVLQAQRPGILQAEHRDAEVEKCCRHKAQGFNRNKAQGTGVLQDFLFHSPLGREAGKHITCHFKKNLLSENLFQTQEGRTMSRSLCLQWSITTRRTQ